METKPIGKKNLLVKKMGKTKTDEKKALAEKKNL